ncbi:DUF5937 family protein [Peribacillus sp. SCS-26]|uniref:ArsR/SmtB family transcription factor n=1 Tax=Paraperibacillus marinus TaxID=3115295 RepID=UPI0039065454
MNIQIQFSPFVEMLASLHVLCNPVHHPYRKQWAAEMEKELPGRLLQEIRLLGAEFYEWFYVVNIVNEYQRPEESVEEGVEFVCSMPQDAFVYYLLGEQYPLEDVRKWREDSRFSPLSPLQKELAANTGKWQRRLQDLFYEYNSKVFARELFRIEPWVAKAASAFQQKLDSSPFEALNELHPDVSVDVEAVKVQKGETYTFPLQNCELITLQPSTFITPHVMLGVYLNRLCLGLHVGVPDGGSSEEPPADLILLLKALGEGNRFKILRDVLYHPYSTKQLAAKHNLTEATISSHMKLLAQAGLVTAERRGYYVFYRGSRSRLESLRADISQFIALPRLEEFIYESDES